MNQHKWIVEIISAYLGSVKTLSDKLKYALTQANLHAAIKNRSIPRYGRTPTNIEYRFHGTGCWISDGTNSVDFDFLSDGNTSGFDAWRLRLFAIENDLTAKEKSLTAFQEALDNLLRSDAIEAIGDSRKYRLTKHWDIIGD